jgi:hypothetical protein
MWNFNNIFNHLINGINHFFINNFQNFFYKIPNDVILYRFNNLGNILGTPLLLYNFFISNNKILYIFFIYIFIQYYENIFLIYNNKLFYIEKLLDIFFTLKILFLNEINSYKKYFILQKVDLYINLDTKIDVTYFFYNNNNIKVINPELISFLFIKENILLDNNNIDNIRLKFHFIFLDKNYIIYFPYKKLIDNNNFKEYYLPYPPFSKKIIEDFRQDIIFPYHNTNNKKKMFYSLFHIDSKDILTVEINKIRNDNLIEYFNKIKTPFLDYGLLYNVPIKLKWILIENNINLNDFKEFYLKFLNLYLCEEDYDLKEHYLLLDKNNLDNFFITDRMKYIFNKKEISVTNTDVNSDANSDIYSDIKPEINLNSDINLSRNLEIDSETNSSRNSVIDSEINPEIDSNRNSEVNLEIISETDLEIM